MFQYASTMHAILACMWSHFRNVLNHFAKTGKPPQDFLQDNPGRCLEEHYL
jgi:hypothetical protein